MMTIEIVYGVMRVHYSKLPKARLVWQAAGLNVYVKGSLGGKYAYEQAANLAMQECIHRHIPVISLKLVKGAKNEHTL